jgi:arylsulfatase A-like enzyme
VVPPTDRISANRSPDWSPNQGQFWREGAIAPNLALDQVLPRLTDEAVQVVAQHALREQEQPLLLYLAYPAPHTPWLPSAKFRDTTRAGLYGDFVAMVDSEIGRVLDALKKAGMAENTLLIFTSDNGPVWFDADKQTYGHDATGGLRGMKSDAWEGGHRMPFVVRWPGVVDAGAKSSQIICFTDLLATFAELWGRSLSPAEGVDSFSFLRVLHSVQPEDSPVRDTLVVQAGSRPSMMSIRMGSWKLITELGSGGFTPPKHQDATPGGPEGQLYNLQSDPGEQNNVYQLHPEVVARCKESLRQIVESGRGRRDAP